MKNRPTYYYRPIENGTFWKFETLTNLDTEESYHSKFETEKEARDFVEKANKTFYLEYYDNDEIKEWFDKIDFTPIFKRVEDLLGMKLTFTVKLTIGYRSKIYNRFEIKSEENLVDFFRVIKAAWKDFRVDTFSAQIYANKETGELELWGNMHYSYEHNDGGTNGAHLFDFNYSESKGWQIR